MNRSFRITSFAGVNSADAPSALPEHQLSSGQNVWSDGGTLHQRPGFRALEDSVGTDASSQVRVFHRHLPEGAYAYTGVSAVCRTTPDRTELIPVLWSPDGTTRVMPAVSLAASAVEVANVCVWCDTPLHGSGIFLVTAARDGSDGKMVKIFELGATFVNSLTISREDLYLPITWRYGFGDAGYTYYDVNMLEPSEPEAPEEPNLLTGGRMVCFTPDDYSSTFVLPDGAVPQDVPLHIVLRRELDTPDAVLDIPAGEDCSQPVTLEDQSVVLYLDRSTGTLTFKASDTPFAVPHYRVQNALRVTYYQYDAEEAFAVVGSDSAEQYFAGRIWRVGCGRYANRLLYSEKDKPFYFHAGASIEVGATEEPVTALARQSKYFFAFKSHEIYRMTITGSEGYDLNEAFGYNQPIRIPKISYKMTTVHSTVGCDCPRSVTFCANRLVWYHSDGNVYTLYGSNGYTEGSVYALGINIRDRLAGLPREGEITAVYHNGYYYLAAGTHIYVCDASVSGFRYLSGYKSPAAGDGGLCWYVWDTPGEALLTALVSEQDRPVWFLDRETGVSLGRFDADRTCDDDGAGTVPIPFSFATALWPGLPERPETIRLVAAHQHPVSVALWDGSHAGRLYTLPSADHPVAATLRPGPVRLPCFGLRFSGEGDFHLHRIGVSYKGL